MQEDLDGYFAAYADAYNAFDATRIAGFFHCPCLMVNETAVVPLTTDHAIESNMKGLIRHHRDNEFGEARVLDVATSVMAPNLALATVHWRVDRPNGDLLWSLRNSYHLVDHGDGWKILVSTTHAAED